MSKLSRKKKENIDDLEKYYGLAENKKLEGLLNNDIKDFKKILKGSDDIIFREFMINDKYSAIIFFLVGFSDNEEINSYILKPLNKFAHDYSEKENTLLKNHIKQEILVSDIKTTSLIKDILNNVLCGKVILLVDKIDEGFIIDVCNFKTRNIEEPVTEPATRGPREGFTEFIDTNITLIRRRLKTPRLKVNKMEVGKLTKTNVIITYIDGIAEEHLIDEIKKRILKIDIDGILESGYIEELIEDNRYSIFSQIGYTERPDRLVACLLEGQVGIIVDNTPIVLIAPQTFIQFIQSSEDYYERYIPSAMIRIIRYLALTTALFLPSIYIAVLTFHPGMLPKALLLNIWASREDVPFPVFVEAIVMEIFFEALREAGVRLPRTTSQTVSIVGALIIGQAAVQAGIVSASMVIVVSVTGISSFIIPQYNLGLSIRVLRFSFMILAGAFGLYGVFMGILIMLIHMAKLESFGVPYLSPLAPLDSKSLKDVFFRAPWWLMKKRPSFIAKKDVSRISEGGNKKNED